ncbi:MULTISPECIES: c-type cytochrome [unclassified Brevundimonas]|uniref:c-type cytochrome n=1 Tax=unclassified Brevundimonas TaxID=2622653 RepID=UPI0011B0C0C7|nr:MULTISPECIES: c-type cytochrome [unclassified Brevundimonas]
MGQSVWDMARGHVGADATLLETPLLSEEARARGALLFAFGDYGGLDTDAMRTVAVPWKLTAAALVMAQAPEDVSQASLRRILTGYGFLYPTEIANWPEGAGAPPKPEAVLGVALGVGRRSLPPIELQIGNIGCAACHAAPTYGADGRPAPDRVWLGAPNPSLDLEAYTQGLYAALQGGVAEPERLMATVRRLYPDMTDREAKTLQSFVMPRVRERMTAIAATGQGVLPFSNGLPGMTNGVAALKLQHGLLADDPDAMTRETGFTSIPHLADRAWRSALLWDGAYAPPGHERFRVMQEADLTDAHRDQLAAITAYFTVPSMGVSGAQARRHVPEVETAWAYLQTVRPQPFPGRIDPARAVAGRDVFQRSCAACHGTYAETAQGPRLIRFPNWAGLVGTDRTRAEAITETLVARVNASPMGGSISAAATGLYAAPPLTGLWQSAPYLHNGSVPSLAALLGLEERPERFRVGGHAMDLERVAIAYPDGYQPYAGSVWVDTRKPGLGARGHETPFADLSREDRLALLEYLKRL